MKALIMNLQVYPNRTLLKAKDRFISITDFDQRILTGAFDDGITESLEDIIYEED